MSRKSVAKTVVMVETKSITKEMDGVRRAIETGIVDVQTITTLKRLLTPRITPTTSITISSKAKSASLKSSRAKKPTKATGGATLTTIAVAEQFPSTELVSATKTIVMKTLTALATEVESRTKKTESSTETTSSKQPVSQGMRNVGICCKSALEALRQWQDHVDIGFAWVNKAYLGYISKLIALEMSETAMKELAIFKSEIEKQLQAQAPIAKPYVSLRKKLQTTTKQNIPPLPNSPFNPLPLMSIPCQGIDDEESMMLVCAFFNLLLRATGVKRTYEADQIFIAALEAPGGPISWIQKLPSSQSSQQIDHLSRALLKIGMNSTSPQIQLSLRTLRHRLALNQSSSNIDTIAKSTFQALRSYYAATKSDKEAYSVCTETLSPMLDKLTASVDGGNIVNFMGLLARKAGLLVEGMRWNDLGLRLRLDDKNTNALFILRNAGIVFTLSIEELNGRVEEQIQERLKHAHSCLSRFDEIDSSAAEQLRDEVDYLRRALLSCPSTTLESKQYLQDIRHSFPRKLLRAFVILADLNSTLLPKLVMPTRALIFDILGSLRTAFSPQSPPLNYVATLELCSSAALKIQDNQTLQFTGNACFNFGNSLFKAGKRNEARRLLEKSLELDFSPLPTDGNPTEEPEQRNLLSRCRKLEMLGECCVKGEEKDAFALILEALNIYLTSISVDFGTMTLSQVMRKEEYLTRLTGVLTKFTKDQSGWSPGDDFPSINDDYSIILNDTVPIEVKAVVYEIQVHVLLGMTHQGQYTTARRICGEILDLYPETHFPIRRVRVIERLLYIAIVEGDGVEDLMSLGASAITALTSTKAFGKDEGLLATRKVLLARCLAWMGLLSDNSDSLKNEYFSQALSIWTRWSEKIIDNSKEDDKDEIIEVTRILELLSDFFEVKSLSLLRVQCLHLLLKLQSHLSNNLDTLISLYASLALQYLNLGYTGKAGTLFAQGLKQMKDSEPSTSIQILWHLNYAEYFARIGIISKAKSHISQAGDVYARNFSNSKTRITSADKAERVLATGRAGFVFSLIAFEENDLEKAIGYIDYAIRVLKTGITAVEKAGRVVKVRSRDYDPFSSDPKPPVEQTENKGIQFGSKLWSFKSAFFWALLQHGVLLTFRGSTRDSEFWLRQAYDAAKSVNARNSMLVATLHLGDLFTRMSSLTNAHEFLSEAAELAEGVDKTKESIVMDLSFFAIHGRKYLWSDAFRSVIRAETKLNRLLEPGFVNGLEKGMGIDWVDRFANLRLSTASPPRNIAGKSPKSSRGRSGRISTTVSRVEYESVTFSKMQVTISENKAYSLARQARFEEGYLAMESIADLDRNGSENLSARITQTKMLLLEVYQLLGSDPLLCVLSESAISIPNVYGKQAKSETAKSRGKRTRARSTKLSYSVNRFQSLLIQAQASIESIFEHACILCPSTLAQAVGLLIGEARLLSSVVNDPDKEQNVLALETIMLLGMSSLDRADSDRSKSVTYRREQAALEYEAKQEYVSLKEVQWPEQKSRPDSSDGNLSDMLTTLYVAPRKKDSTLTAENLLHGIPTGCTVVSIHLSESKEHFILSKVHSQGCVVVRLPLIKHPPEGDEEPFTFENAYAELTEIINLNNQSAQAAKDVPDREAKESWWTTRKELDSRLGVFLQNMETCWIGGFTGMFRGFFPNDEIFAKFRFAFRQILIKFLPSRKEGDTQMELNPRLVDLFLSLKSDKPDMDTEVADQVEDLICFALDNFKFRGEQIAIDEIDLDAMTIDIQEAIRCYHEAVAARKQEHVVLILDKGLHMFPWESLPCLRGRSVSRLPSLGSLMERIVDSPIDGASWPSVTPNRGFFVLNPEGDLTYTQSQFENTLTKIDGWNGIVGRAPMDQEILSALRNNDIFLYFGHGSGEQYVKSAKVKRLQHCAVTMLFGCSSGKLRDAGDFEPWGTPFTYLLGGSPAMLANLWDVTDRDIDRLSYGVFSRWGLCDERPKSRGSDDGTFEPERGMGIDFGGATLGERKRQLQANMKGKKFISMRKGVSLTEALAVARDDCTLKYLNGAAPVVYGVPVFLEKNSR